MIAIECREYDKDVGGIIKAYTMAHCHKAVGKNWCLANSLVSTNFQSPAINIVVLLAGNLFLGSKFCV